MFYGELEETGFEVIDEAFAPLPASARLGHGDGRHVDHTPRCD
jgi:hypothetical protein